MPVRDLHKEMGGSREHKKRCRRRHLCRLWSHLQTSEPGGRPVLLTVGGIINFVKKKELWSYFENQNSYFVVTQPWRAATQKFIPRPAEHTAEVSSSQFLFTSSTTDLLHQPAKVSENGIGRWETRGSRSRRSGYRQEFWSCFAFDCDLM